MRRTVSMSGIIFIFVQMVVLFVLSGCTPATAQVTATLPEAGFTISLNTFITILSFFGGLVAVYIDIRLRNRSLEIKQRQVEKWMEEHESDNDSDICKIEEIIQNHSNKTQSDLKELSQKVNDLHVLLVEKFKK